MTMKMNKETRSKILEKKSFRNFRVENRASIDEENRTVQIAFASEEPYERWWGIEIIDVKAMNIDRLNDGGALLWNHDNDSKDAHIGTVEKAWIDSDNVARAVVRFSKKAAAEEIWQDVLDGIIKHVSFGYMIEDFDLVKEGEKKDEPNTYKVQTTSFEVSFVHTPADTTVGIGRSVEDGPDENVVPVSTDSSETKNNSNLEVSEMENEQTVETIDKNEIASQAKAEYKAYCSEVKDLCKLAGHAEKADELIEKETSIAEVRKALWNAKAEKEKEIKSIPTVEAGDTHNQKRKAEIEKGFAYAIDGKNERAETFNFESYEQLGRALLAANGVDSSLMGKSEIVSFLLGRSHSTSDWTDILANIGGKQLLGSYDSLMAKQSWRGLVEETQVSDYKDQTVYRMGEMPGLLLKEEGAEYKAGTLGNSKEVYKIADYGRKFSLTDRMLRNDDLSAFRALSRFGSAIARIETSLFWAEFLTGTIDGVPIFDAAHGNIISTTDIDVDGLGKGIEAMMKKEGLDVKEPLNLTPENVIVPVSKLRLAQQYLSSNFTADSNGNVNPYGGQFGLIADARLDKDSTANWYMAAGRGQVDMFRMAYLSGQRSPVYGSKMDFDTDSIEFKVKHSCAIKAIDHRGLVKLVP